MEQNCCFTLAGLKKNKKTHTQSGATAVTKLLSAHKFKRRKSGRRRRRGGRRMRGRKSLCNKKKKEIQ